MGEVSAAPRMMMHETGREVGKGFESWELGCSLVLLEPGS